MLTTNYGSSSAETIANNEDLVTQILIRVPVKPLLRFKCVSKHWLSLISSSHFHHHHNQNQKQNHPTSLSAVILRRNPSFFQFVPLKPTKTTTTTTTTPPFTSLHFINQNSPSNIKILHSCHGLFLCRGVQEKNILNQNKRYCYYVCNFTTKQSTTLPSIHSFSPNEPISIFGLTLAFEPSKSPHYQVICVRSTKVSMYYYQIEVYSSKTRTWRTSGSPFVAPFDIVFDNGVFCNGAVHWISPSGSAVYYDIERERVEKMPTLVEGRCKRRYRYFGESNGHMHLVDICGVRTTKFKVFEMEWDYSKWFVKYEVDLDEMVATFPEMVRDYLDPCDSFYYAFVIVFVVRNENEEESSLLLHIPGKIISYNFRDKTFKKVCDLTPIRNETKRSLQFGWLDAYQFVETLACVC
ncbi:hypothetical protein ACB092_07G041100 [Castanea dentata]